MTRVPERSDRTPRVTAPSFQGDSPIRAGRVEPAVKALDVVLPSTPSDAIYPAEPPLPVHRIEVPASRGTETQTDSAITCESFILRDESSINKLASAHTAYFVEIRIAPVKLRDDPERNVFVVRCVTSSGPIDPRDWPMLLHMSSEGDDGKGESLTPWQEAIGNYLTKKLVEPDWHRITTVWHTPICAEVAAVADELDILQNNLHELMLGQTVHSAGRLVGLDPSASNIFAEITSSLPLPFDKLIKEGKRALEYTGIAAGVAMGNPLLLNACVKALAHDFLIEQVANRIGTWLRETLQPLSRWNHPLIAPLRETSSPQRDNEVYAIEAHANITSNTDARQENPQGPPPLPSKENVPLADEPRIDPKQRPSNYGHPRPRL